MHLTIQTLRGKIIFLFLFLLIPVATVVYLNGRSLQNSWRTYQVTKLEDEAQLLSSAVDMRLHLLEDTLSYLPYSGASFSNILHAPLDSMETQDFWLSVNEVRQHLKSIRQVYPFVEALFAYFPQKDLFFNEMVRPQVASQIRRELSESGKREGSEWKSLTVEGREYLYWTYPCGGYYVGAWLEAGMLLSGLSTASQSGEGKVWVMDYLGRTLSGDEKVSLSADQLGLTVPWSETFFTSRFALHPGVYIGLALDGRELWLTRQWYLSNTVLIVLLCLGMLLAMVLSISRWVLAPTRNLIQGMEWIGDGNIDYRFPAVQREGVEFLRIKQEFNQMMDTLEQMKVRIYEQTIAQNEIKLRYLSQQIQPHFILNSLNTLYTYSSRDVEVTKGIIKLLSKYYRYVVNVESQYVKLSQELEHIENYLSLQRIRFPNKLSYEIVCEDAVKIVPIPPFLLESFVGNSLKHGQDEQDKISIRVEAEEVEPFLIEVRVCDQGGGFTPEILDALELYQRTGEKDMILGAGMVNSIERLRLIYQNRATIHFENAESGGACVRLLIQLGRGKEEA